MAEPAIVEALRRELKRHGWTDVIVTDCHRFRDERLSRAYALWHSKIGPDGLPFRRDFTPRLMQPFIDRTALFERTPEPDGTHRYKVRLTGTEFARIWAEMSGKLVSEVVPAAYQARWFAIADLLAHHKRPFRLIGVPESFSRRFLVVELFIAPLLNDAGAVTLALAVASWDAEHSWAEIRAEERKARG